MAYNIFDTHSHYDDDKFDKDRVKFVDDICAAAKGFEYMAELQMKSGRI